MSHWADLVIILRLVVRESSAECLDTLRGTGPLT